MADTKTAPVQKPAVEAVEESTATTNEQKFTLDSKEVSRVISVLRYRLNEQVREANRKNPIFSESQEIARAKAQASLRALQEFASTAL